MKGDRVRRGVVIVTALFVVLVLFGMVTAIHLMVTQNFQVTRHGHMKTQALWLARAAANRGLQALNEDASFQTLHLGEARRFVERRPDGVLETWVEPTNEPDVFLVRGRATEAGAFSETTTLTVVRKEPAEGFLFARAADDKGFASTFAYMNSKRLKAADLSGSDWSLLPPPPNIFYNSTGAIIDRTADGDPTNDFTQDLRSPTADKNGNLFAVRVRDGADTVVKYSTDTSKWSLMPPVPLSYYTSGGTLIERSTVASNLSDLASDGKDRLYVRHGRDGIDTVYLLDQASAGLVGPSAQQATWKPLPPVPLFTYDGSGRAQRVPTSYVGGLLDYSADSRGSLYARYPRDGVDTIYRYDPYAADPSAPSAWSVLPPTPQAYYRKVRNSETGQRELALVENDSQVAYNLKSLSVGEYDSVYAVYDRKGVDTVYKFDREDQQWSVQPPVPAAYYSDAEDERISTSSTLGATAIRGTAADADDNLYVRYPRDGVDSLFAFDAKNQSYNLLPPVPNKRYTTSGPNPNMVDRSNRGGNGGVLSNISEIAGGGRPDATRGPRFVLQGRL